MSVKLVPELPELPELPEVIAISLAAELLGMSRQAVYKKVWCGNLKAWRLRSAGNDHLVVREVDVLAMQKLVLGVGEDDGEYSA